MALLEALVGERRTSYNVQSDARAGAYSELIVNDVGLGRYFEATRLARTFTSTVKSVTVAATHNTPIAAATATPVLGLVNPNNSLKGLVLTRIVPGTTSGTPAGGQFMLNAITGVGSSISATQTGSIFSNIIKSTSASPQNSVCKVYNNVALTGLSPAASAEIALVGQATAAAAAGNGGPGASADDLGGLFIVPPDTLVALMAGTGAGTTWIVNASWTWVEIDWPL